MLINNVYIQELVFEHIYDDELLQVREGGAGDFDVGECAGGFFG